MNLECGDEMEISTEFCLRRQIIENLKHKNLNKENLKCKKYINESGKVFTPTSRKVKEFSDNEINPFKIYLIADDLNIILRLIVAYFSLSSKKHQIFLNQLSSKLQVAYEMEVCDSDFDNFVIEVEIKKDSDNNNLWIIELNRVKGDKKFLSDIFEEMQTFIKNKLEEKEDVNLNII